MTSTKTIAAGREAVRQQGCFWETEAGLRPEGALLLTCARLSLADGPHKRVDHLLQGQLDWRALLVLAARHRLSPLLHRHLGSRSTATVPREVLGQLWSSFEATARRSEKSATQLLNVLRHLDAHGIPAIPYKGPALAAAVYGDLGLRRFDDLDIVVRPRDVRPAKALLEDLGYRSAYPLSTAAQAQVLRASSQHHLTLAHAQSQMPVELHWRTHADFPVGRVSDESWWDSLPTVRLGDARVLSFTSEELLLLLCVHGAQHQWSSLHWLVDVAELIRRRPKMRWATVRAMATDLGCERRLALGVHLASDLLEAPVPDLVRSHAAAQRGIRAVAVAICERLFAEHDLDVGTAARLRFYAKLNDRWRHTVRHGLRAAVSPSLVEWSRWPLPPRYRVLYGPLRLLRLARKYGGRRLIRDHAVRWTGRAAHGGSPG